jgi:hypothetical protein
MQFLLHDFRNALVILKARPAFAELESVLHAVQPADILSKYDQLAAVRSAKSRRPPAGGQSALNAVLDERLTGLGWEPQPHLFTEPELENWKMDFRKDGIGVEVSFNHAEAIPWQFTRLNIAGESTRVRPDNRIDVGVVICAAPDLKSWARMDSSVGTFQQFQAWLREMRPILPVPLLLIGLEAADWSSATSFRGTDSGNRTSQRPGADSGPTVDASDNVSD